MAITLASGSGTVASHAIQDPFWSAGKLLVPDAPLVNGKGYSLTYNETCTSAGGMQPASATIVPFTAIASVAVPTAMGILKSDTPVIGPLSVGTSSGSCSTSIQAASIAIRLVPSPGLAAFAPVTAYRIRVDGTEWGTVFYGSAPMAVDDSAEIEVASLYAACGSRAAENDNGLTLGTHQVDVTAHVAGAPSDPPAQSLALTFSCDGVDGGLGTSFDGGVGDGGGAVGNADGGGLIALDVPQGSPAASSGCSFRTTRSGVRADAAGLLVALGAVVAGLSRRRRRG